ncbi:ComF family protein, partial [Xanthomonas oryzae pv. oryzae]
MSMGDAVNVNQVRSVYRWPQRVFRLLLPSLCLVCAEAGTADGDLCPSCRAALPDHGHACL